MLRRLNKGFAGRFFGRSMAYGVGTLCLAAASILMIPAMVSASGPGAWAAVASGQAFGGIAATLITFGWGYTGPASIAAVSSPAERWREYVDSLRVRLVLLFPSMAAAVAIGVLLNGGAAEMAGIGALNAGLAGLSASWYFVGADRPDAFLVLECVPRVAMTLIAIALMGIGASALIGVAVQSLGFVVTFLLSTWWISRLTASRAREASSCRSSLMGLLKRHGAGLSSSLLSSTYMALPIAMVGVLAPGSLPHFAIVDKAQKQIITGIQPIVTALQGTVVNEGDSGPRRALLISIAGSALLAAGLTLLGEPILIWLAAGQVQPSAADVWLLAAISSAALLDSFLARAILASRGEMRWVALQTMAGFLVGGLGILILTFPWGATGALVGMLAGLIVRAAMGLCRVLMFNLQLNMGSPAERSEARE